MTVIYKVRGEVVTVIGPKPDGFVGLASTIEGADTLVRYPDGEVGAVPKKEIKEVKD